MSFSSGMAAINLEMTDKVPRTEYSASEHWELVKAVTGIDVNAHSPGILRHEASSAFMKAWDYCFNWSTLTDKSIFGERRSSMGHAVYAPEGADFDTNIFQLFTDPEDVLNFDPWEAYGKRDINKLTKDFENHYKANCLGYSDAVNMTGIYVTCMSGLIDMFGWDMLLTAAGLNPEKFGDVTNRYAFWIQQYFDALASADVTVVMVHDDIVWTEGAFIHPDWYRKYIFPNYKKYLAPLIESGKKIIYTSDGNYTQFIDDIAMCGVNGFVMEPLTDMKYIAEKYGRTHTFIGNADTRIILYGSKEDIYNEVKRCMDIGKKYPGFIMAVGNHIPSNTPVDSVLYYNEIYEKLSKR